MNICILNYFNPLKYLFASILNYYHKAISSKLKYPLFHYFPTLNTFAQIDLVQSKICRIHNYLHSNLLFTF